MSQPWYVTECTPPLTFPPTHKNTFSVIEVIKCGHEDLIDDLVSTIIDKLDGIHILGGFKHNQIRKIL